MGCGKDATLDLRRACHVLLFGRAGPRGNVLYKLDQNSCRELLHCHLASSSLCHREPFCCLVKLWSSLRRTVSAGILCGLCASLPGNASHRQLRDVAFQPRELWLTQEQASSVAVLILTFGHKNLIATPCPLICAFLNTSA